MPAVVLNQSTNSSIACLYPRCDSELLRLFSTAVLACSRSRGRKTLRGRLVRRFRFCFMVRGLHCHEPSDGTGRLPDEAVQIAGSPTIRELRPSGARERMLNDANCAFCDPAFHCCLSLQID